MGSTLHSWRENSVVTITALLVHPADFSLLSVFCIVSCIVFCITPSVIIVLS